MEWLGKGAVNLLYAFFFFFFFFFFFVREKEKNNLLPRIKIQGRRV